MPPFDLTVERERSDVFCPPCTQCEQGASTFCSGLSAEQGRRLLAIRGMAQFEAETTLFREGDPALHLFSIASGAVKLYKLLSDGRRQITAFLFAGDFFGLGLQGGYAYTAEAMTQVHLCRFPVRRLELLFADLPQLEKRLLGLTAQELAAAHDQMLLLGRKTAREKVATFLVGLWRRLRKATDPAGALALPMSRSDIADHLGLTIETVSRVLTAFKREGLIVLPNASQVALRLPEDLARIADGG